jgi:hypothetical protein
MTTIEIKNSIIRRIAEIDDMNFLKALKTIVDSNPSDSVFSTTGEMKKKIEFSRKQAESGHVLSNDELSKEINAWLKQGK